MDLVEALRTTGSARDFTDQPVDDATVAAILDDARFAPSGGNRQPWRVAVVKDSAIRRSLADLMTVVWHEYLGEGADTSRAAFAFGRSTGATPIVEPNPLLDDVEHVPVMLAIAADLNKIALMDANTSRPPLTAGGSIYPFCWSILLAAPRTRARRSHDHVLVASGRCRGTSARVTEGPRLGCHRFPRLSDAPQHETAPRRGIGVRDDRSIRRTTARGPLLGTN